MTAAGNVGSRDARRIAILVVRWLVPVLILGAFVVSGHLHEALSTVLRVNAGWAILLVVAGVALPLSHAWRWCYLLKRVDVEVPVAGSARVTSLASLVNYAAPGFLGAPAKAIFARESYKVPISQSLPTLVVEQALDALMLLFAGTLAVILAGPAMIEIVDSQNVPSQAVAGLLMLSLLAVIAVVSWWLGRRLLPGFYDALRTATGALLRSAEHRRPILTLTAARWALDMLAVTLASFAVGLRLGLVEILLLANISLLAGLLAPVPGGLGVREAAMASVAGVIGISIPAILALSILHRAGLALGLPLVLGGSRVYEWSAQ